MQNSASVFPASVAITPQVPLGPDFAIENNGYHELKAGGDWPCIPDPCDQAKHAKWDSRALSVH
jgi:hypothetical protein